MYQLIINNLFTGSVHTTHKSISYDITELQRDVTYYQSLGCTIIEVQIKVNGKWQTT